MEAQVENNVKNKQTNKQRKEKKTYVQTELNHWKIAEVEKILERKNLLWTRENDSLLLWTGAPGLTPRSCCISCRQNSYFLFLAGSFVINNITCNM